MDRHGVTAFILVGSILGGEAAGEIGKHGLYWQPDHVHVETAETDAGAYRRTISVDSNATSTAATPNSLELLRRLGYRLPIVK